MNSAEMSAFQKVSTDLPKIKGYQKACILLSEIGAKDQNLSRKILDLVQLTPKQVRQMSRAYKTLGVFSIKNKKVVQRENLVLQEAIDYGVSKGFFVPEYRAKSESGTKEIKEMVNKSPDSIAKLIGTWLDE